MRRTQKNLDREWVAGRLMAVMLGARVWEGAGEWVDEVLKEASRRDFKDLVERVQGKLVPSRKLAARVDELVEEFTNDEYWRRLETDLAHRDMDREGDDWDVELHDKYHEKWAVELEEHGIERLDVAKKEKVKKGRVAN